MSSSQQSKKQVFKKNKAHTNEDQNDQWHGDNLETPKRRKNVRVVFHNVNGFKDRESGVFQELLHEQHSLSIDIQCISEHQRDTQQFQVFNDLQEILQREHPGQAVLQIDSSTAAATHSYKPGGTAILVMGNIIGRMEPKGKGGDAMGRWSYVTLRRKNTAPLTIISAYQSWPISHEYDWKHGMASTTTGTKRPRPPPNAPQESIRR